MNAERKQCGGRGRCDGSTILPAGGCGEAAVGFLSGQIRVNPTKSNQIQPFKFLGRSAAPKAVSPLRFATALQGSPVFPTGNVFLKNKIQQMKENRDQRPEGRGREGMAVLTVTGG